MATSSVAIPSKLRHIQSFYSSGTFYVPQNVNSVYVAVYGGSAGGYGGYRSGSNRYGYSYGSGPNGGTGPIAGGFVNVVSGAALPVVVGGAGSGGSSNYGSSGGTSSFDSAITCYGGNANGTAGTYAAVTTLPSQNPGAATLTRVSGVTSVGSQAGGTASSYPTVGGAGTAGSVHIFGY